MISENRIPTNNSLTLLFNSYARSERPPVIELQNINHEPVAAIYLSMLHYDKLVVSETNNTEHYYLFVDGVGIYFSYFIVLQK